MPENNQNALELEQWQEALSTLYVETIGILSILHKRNKLPYDYSAHLELANSLKLHRFIEETTDAFNKIQEKFAVSVYYKVQFENLMASLEDTLASDRIEDLQVEQLLGESGTTPTSLEPYARLIAFAIDGLQAMESTCEKLWAMIDRLDDETFKERLETSPLSLLSKDELKTHVLSSELTLSEMRYLNMIADSLITVEVLDAKESTSNDDQFGESYLMSEFTWKIKKPEDSKAKRKVTLTLDSFIAA